MKVLISVLDQRCSEEFLKKLPIQSISDLNSGYGCATLFWLNKESGNINEYNAAGTIQDYITFT